MENGMIFHEEFFLALIDLCLPGKKKTGILPLQGDKFDLMVPAELAAEKGGIMGNSSPEGIRQADERDFHRGSVLLRPSPAMTPSPQEDQRRRKTGIRHRVFMGWKRIHLFRVM
jgi:hypothetical protein